MRILLAVIALLLVKTVLKPPMNPLMKMHLDLCEEENDKDRRTN